MENADAPNRSASVLVKPKGDCTFLSQTTAIAHDNGAAALATQTLHKRIRDAGSPSERAKSPPSGITAIQFLPIVGFRSIRVERTKCAHCSN